MPLSKIESSGLGTPLALSTATVTTLNAPSGVLATQNGMNGIAKAWGNINYDNGTIRGAFNISSVTKVGTGDCYMYFTTPFSNANNMCAISASSAAVTNNGVFNKISSLTTTYVQIQHWEAGTLTNVNEVDLAVFGL